MNLKTLLISVFTVVVGMVAYNMFVKKLFKLDSYEMNYEVD